VPRTFSVLLAEANLLLREKIASVLARSERIWCVIQVDGTEGLSRCAGRLQPDLILADLCMLKDPDILKLLRRSSAGSRIIALADSQSEPYVEAARRLGLDGAVERGRACECIIEELRLLSADWEGAGGGGQGGGKDAAGADGGSDAGGF
jgi:DNA-binding NarL/FixJ family response regulator